jgi:hypothetical protein
VDFKWSRGDSIHSSRVLLQDSAPCVARHGRYLLRSATARLVNWRDRLFDPASVQFFVSLTDGGYDPNAHIDVLPEHRLIYLSVPKCASTTIKVALSALNECAVIPDKVHKRRHSGLRSPAQIGFSAFHRLATSPSTLRFAFVRNPYARLVSAWADKFQGKPLVAGDSFVEKYLTYRGAIDHSLVHGPDCTLSFAQFVIFAAGTALDRVDAHWQAQHDLLDMPGIKLDHIGKVESFRGDFAPVLEHLGRGSDLLRAARFHLNASRHRAWPDYYSPGLAERIYRAYERDFDLLGYPRALPSSAT